MDFDPAAAPIPIACTLTTKEAASQALEWVDLGGHAAEVGEIDGGARMILPAVMLDDIEDLARRERSCCAFLTISTAVVDGVLRLDLTSDNRDALRVISALAGLRLL